jgi:hypothetical protein
VFQSFSVDYYLEISTTVPRLSFLTHFADIFIQYSVRFQDDASLSDSTRACNDVMRLAFTNRPEFLLNNLSDDSSSSSTTSNTASKKRKRIQSSELDPTCRCGRILARGYPFLVRLQIFLMNDERGKAFALAKEMEHCCALSEDERATAWGFVMNYLQDIGQIFLDNNDRNSPAYLQKRQSLISLRQHMGNLGLDMLVDYYKQLIEEVSKDPYATPQEIHYVTRASQHTVLRLLMLVNVDDGIKRMLDEFPSLYVWGDNASARQTWAMHFLQTQNAIPESIFLDGNVDLRSLLSRAPKEEEEEVAPRPVPEGEEIEFEVVEEAPEQVVQEHEVDKILASSVEDSADQEAYSAEEPEVEEILDSSDEEPAEEQDVEEILDSSDTEKDQQVYSDEQEQFDETIDSSEDESVGQDAYSDDESDDEQLEESVDSDEYSAGQEPYHGTEIVEIVDSSSDDAEEHVSGTEQEVEDSESEQQQRQPHGGEETADEDEVAAQNVEDHESEPEERRTHDGEETADEDDVAALFGSNVAGERLELVREAIDYYDEVESSDESRRGSFEGEEEAQGAMEHDEDSSDKEEVHEQEQRDVGKIVDSSEATELAHGEDQGDDQYSSDAEEVAREEEGDGDSSEDEVVVIDDAGSNEAEPEEVGEEDHVAEGYEPDTAGQTESEEEDDDRRARNEASATRRALGSDQIAFRTTFSDMDAADERDESSGVEDNIQKERSFTNVMDSEASSTLVAFAQSAQKEVSVTWEEENETYTSTSCPPPANQLTVTERVVDILPNLEPRRGDDTNAAVAASDAERYLSEDGTVSVVDAVPRIEDVHEREDDTTATVAFSEASQSFASQPLTETNIIEREREQEHAAIVNQVPTVEDAQLGDNTSAAVATSEAGRYLSEANTERITQPEESVDIEKHEKFPCAANGAEKDTQVAVEDSSSIVIIEAKGKPESESPRGASDGVLSDRAGYEADEEKTDVENSARSVPDETEVENSTRSFAGTETTGYEADIEEKTPLFTPSVTTVDVGMETFGHGYEADAEEKSAPEVEESQSEPSPPGDSSGIVNLKAKGAPCAQEDESVLIHPGINSMSVAIAETESHEPLPGPSPKMAAKPNDSGNEAETRKVDSVSSSAPRDDESGSIAASRRPSGVPSAHAAAESDDGGVQAEEHIIASSSSVVVATREDETGSVASSVSQRKAPSKQQSDLEYYETAAKKKRREIEPKNDDVSAGTPTAEDVQEIAQVFPRIPASATAEELDASSSAHPHSYDAVETGKKPRATRRPTRGNREKKDDNKDEPFIVPQPSRPSTRGRTTSSLRTHSHDASVETESKDSATERKSRATRNSREKKGEDEEVETDTEDEEAEIDMKGASDELHRIMALKVADLRVELRQRGLDTIGLKKELQIRLLRDAEETMNGLGSPERHTRSHDSATRSSHDSIQGLVSPAGHTRSHDSPVTTRHSRATRTSNASEAASKASTKKFKLASKAATEKSKAASKTATKNSKADLTTSTADSKASTRKSGTRSSTKGAKSEAGSENRDSLGSNPEGRAISFPEHDESNDYGSLSSVESSVPSPARSRPTRAATGRTLLVTVLENEDSSSIVSSVRDAEETMKELGSPERHTRSHDFATRSSHQSIEGLESLAGRTRSHNSPVSTRRSRATTQTKNADEGASKASMKKFKPALSTATKKSEIASETATKESKTDSVTSTADSKASTRKSRTRSFTKGAKSEADSENRKSLGSNPEGRAISFPEHDESNDYGSLSSVQSSVTSPARSRPTRAATRRTSLGTVPENEDLSSVVSSVRGRRKQAATHGASLATVPENDSGETLSARTARATRSDRSNVEEAPAKRRKSDRSVASAASTTRSGRVRR